MIQKIKFSVASLFLIVGFLAFGSITNAQTPSSTPPPTVTTGTASLTSPTAANLSGNITDTGGVPTVSRRGIKYGPAGLTVNGNPVYNNSICADGSFATGNYSFATGGTCGGSTSSALECGKSYQYVAFATNAYGYNEGLQRTFSTQACSTATPTPQAPALNQPTASPITPTSERLSGDIQSSTGSNITERGFDYGPSNGPTTYNATIQDTGTFGIGPYWKDISNLTCGTQYNYRSFATNASGRTNGSMFTFNTGFCPSSTPVTPVPPSISTPTASAVSAASATLNGNITSIGSSNVTSRGFNYGLTSAYGTTAIESAASFSTGAFSLNISGLTCEKKYYFNSFATNSAGSTSTSPAQSFTTTACSASTPTSVPVAKPTINLPTIATITQTSAIVSSNVTDTGGENLSMRGFNLGTTTSYGTNYIVSGSFGTGSFTRDLAGLTCDTQYHVRATGTNSAGTQYTNDVTFTTQACTTIQPTPTNSVAPSTPTLSNLPVTSLAATTVTLNASIDETGGAGIIERGFEYGLAQYVYGTTTLQNSGPYTTGNFSSNLTNLICNKTYHYHAFAKNSGNPNTTYTPDETFTTLSCPTPTATPVPQPPTIAATPTASNITRKTVTMTSQIVSGNATERGFRYGWSSGNYGGIKKETAETFNPGIFTMDITGLAPNTTHFIQAYAKNGAGDPVYSNEISFKTLPSPGNLTGWAWSSTIGWVNLSSISIDQATGDLKGFAESLNIGHIKFHDLGNYPTTGAPGVPANVNLDTGEVKGWIRACAGTVTPADCSSMDSRTDGWDGWIELAGANHQSITPEVFMGKNVMSGLRMNLNTGVIGGMAWGSNIVGWLNFNAATSSNQTAFTATCTSSNLGNGKVRFIALPVGGNGSYTFNWNNQGYSPSPTYERPIQNGEFVILLSVKDTSQVASIDLQCKYTPPTPITIIENQNGNGPCYVDPRTILIGEQATFRINGTVNPPSVYKFTWLDGVINATSSVPNKTNTYDVAVSKNGTNQTSVQITDISNTTAKNTTANILCGDLNVSPRELKLNIGTNAGDIANKLQNGNGAKSLLIKQGSPFRVQWKNTLSMYDQTTNPLGYTCTKPFDINSNPGWKGDWTGSTMLSSSFDSHGNEVGTYKLKIACTSGDAVNLPPQNDEVILKVISSTVKEI